MRQSRGPRRFPGSTQRGELGKRKTVNRFDKDGRPLCQIDVGLQGRLSLSDPLQPQRQIVRLGGTGQKILRRLFKGREASKRKRPGTGLGVKISLRSVQGERNPGFPRAVAAVPFPVSWTVKMKKKQKETQDILSYHSQAAGCSDKARAKASGGRQPIEECGRTGL